MKMRRASRLVAVVLAVLGSDALLAETSAEARARALVAQMTLRYWCLTPASRRNPRRHSRQFHPPSRRVEVARDYAPCLQRGYYWEFPHRGRPMTLETRRKRA